MSKPPAAIIKKRASKYTKRAIYQSIMRAKTELGLEVEVFSDTWAYRLSKNDQVHYIFANRFDCNKQAPCDIARDKAAASEIMAAARVACVIHTPVQSKVWTQVDPLAITDAVELYGTVVVKPLRGHQGKDVAAFDSAAKALTFMNQADTNIWCASPFVSIVKELRLVVFRGVVLLAYEKFDPVEVNGLRLFNLEHGTSARNIPVDLLNPAVADLAKRAMNAIGLELAAVDIVVDDSGEAQVLEINHGFSLHHYSDLSKKQHEQVVDLYFRIISDLFD